MGISAAVLIAGGDRIEKLLETQIIPSVDSIILPQQLLVRLKLGPCIYFRLESSHDSCAVTVIPCDTQLTLLIDTCMRLS